MATTSLVRMTASSFWLERRDLRGCPGLRLGMTLTLLSSVEDVGEEEEEGGAATFAPV